MYISKPVHLIDSSASRFYEPVTIGVGAFSFFLVSSKRLTITACSP